MHTQGIEGGDLQIIPGHDIANGIREAIEIARSQSRAITLRGYQVTFHLTPQSDPSTIFVAWEKSLTPNGHRTIQYDGTYTD